MKRSVLLFSFLLFLFSPIAAEEQQRPNIVLIMMDDMGFPTLVAMAEKSIPPASMPLPRTECIFRSSTMRRAAPRPGHLY